MQSAATLTFRSIDYAPLRPGGMRFSPPITDHLFGKFANAHFPQHCLNFLPEPQGQGALRPAVSMAKVGLRFGRLSLSSPLPDESTCEGSTFSKLPLIAMLF
jgi:hypothetical protein